MCYVSRNGQEGVYLLTSVVPDPVTICYQDKLMHATKYTRVLCGDKFHFTIASKWNQS